jgi:peptidoglycan hydrolase CwlO-like protein
MHLLTKFLGNSKMKTRILLCVVLSAVVIAMAGCGAKADENKSMSEVKSEAETMSVEKLKATAVSYKKAIEAKKPELEKIVAKLKEIPMTEMLGTEAKSFKTDIDDMNKSISALRERFDVYYGKLKELKADVSDLTL